jgi:wyosine [tRNA(Phe)-imidazoG37] synthetase (radical SAM superfamily)
MDPSMAVDDFKYVFGPVVSRRLGRSLGVDVVPFKTCTFDCVYCQLGPTTHHTVERGDFVPMEAVVSELSRKLEARVEADYITIAGSGEPTLYLRLGELIHAVKGMTATPVAVLTNGSLLWDLEVQEALLEADLVVPSLDAATPESYATVNRPCFGVPFEKTIEGLVAFRKRFRGQYWLEVLLLRDVAANELEIERLAELIARIRPDRVQLHTVARPAPAGDALPVPQASLKCIARRLGSNVQIVGASDPSDSSDRSDALPVTEAEVLNLIRRHPCTQRDIAAGLRAAPHVVERHLVALVAQRAIRPESRDGETFYLGGE